jgi:hypothetical protein
LCSSLWLAATTAFNAVSSSNKATVQHHHHHLKKSSIETAIPLGVGTSSIFSLQGSALDRPFVFSKRALF